MVARNELLIVGLDGHGQLRQSAEHSRLEQMPLLEMCEASGSAMFGMIKTLMKLKLGIRGINDMDAGISKGYSRVGRESLRTWPET